MTEDDNKAQKTPIMITDTLGTVPTNDGSHLLLGLDGTGTEYAFALPFDEIPVIMNAISQGYEALQKVRAEQNPEGDQGPSTVPASHVEWFEIAAWAEGGALLSLTISNGPKLHYLLPVGMAEQLLETAGVLFPNTQKNEIPPSSDVH